MTDSSNVAWSEPTMLGVGKSGVFVLKICVLSGEGGWPAPGGWSGMEAMQKLHRLFEAQGQAQDQKLSEFDTTALRAASSLGSRQAG